MVDQIGGESGVRASSSGRSSIEEDIRGIQLNMRMGAQPSLRLSDNLVLH